MLLQQYAKAGPQKGRSLCYAWGMTKGRAEVVVGIKTVNITGKVIFSRDLYNRFNILIHDVDADSELSLSESLQLRQLARELIEEAEVA